MRRSINPEENVMAQHDYSRKEVLDIVEQVARQKGLPVDDFMRFAHIETGGTFNERAHNTSSGAKGLFQFVPGSARQYHLTGHEFDPTRNTEAAAKMYQDNLDSMATSAPATRTCPEAVRRPAWTCTWPTSRAAPAMARCRPRLPPAPSAWSATATAKRSTCAATC